MYLVQKYIYHMASRLVVIYPHVSKSIKTSALQILQCYLNDIHSNVAYIMTFHAKNVISK